MLDLAELARLEERRLCAGLASVAAEHRWLPSGGIMTRGEPGTWINMSAGLGMNGAVPGDDLDSLIHWFQAARIEPRVELCPFADPSVIAGLAARNFTLRAFENVFFRDLTDGSPITAPSPLAPGIEITLISGAPDAVLWEYAAAVAQGFAPDATSASPDDIALWVRVLRQPAVRAFAAIAGKRVVGGGAMEIPVLSPTTPAPPADEEEAPRRVAAALFGLSVQPEFRRKGVQQALIAARLEAARAAGATVATIGATPGVATERNARRMGFQVGYTKATLARPGPGLTPNL